MRKIIDFNNDWYFSKDNSSGEIVTLPHTWNSIDGMDGKNGYARGTYYYTKTFSSPKLQPGEKVILEIPAAALSARVFLNGGSNRLPRRRIFLLLCGFDKTAFPSF